MPLPLQGLRVLDFTSLLPGPLASVMLAAAGAEVTKVERPEGDDAARVPPFVEGRSVLYEALNQSKRVIRLDLKTAEGREAARALATTTDVVLTQVRPGVMERLGLGYEDLRALKPDLLYCAITGYGQHGPLAARAGHDLNYLAQSGVLHACAGSPSVSGALMADVGGGSLPAVINILLALRHRDQTGEGAFLDISITDNLRAFIPHVTAQWQVGGTFEAARSPFGGASPRYRLYATADGGHLVVGALEEKFWQRFCEVVGLDAAAPAEAIEARVLARTCAGWQQAFAGEDCCVCVLSRDAGDPPASEALHLPVLPQFRGAAAGVEAPGCQNDERMVS